MIDWTTVASGGLTAVAALAGVGTSERFARQREVRSHYEERRIEAYVDVVKWITEAQAILAVSAPTEIYEDRQLAAPLLPSPDVTARMRAFSNNHHATFEFEMLVHTVRHLLREPPPVDAGGVGAAALAELDQRALRIDLDLSKLFDIIRADLEAASNGAPTATFGRSLRARLRRGDA